MTRGAEGAGACRVRRALLSVSDKRGLVDFARGLAELGVEILSTGGTAAALREAGIPVREVAEYTGFPEILDGRVKTLHPAIHAGILFRRDLPAHVEAMRERGLGAIDLVAVNLYPFQETVSRAGTTLDEAIEQIDIGGPSMVRSAAKNHRDVVVVVSPDRYGEVLSALREAGDLSPEARRGLALEAFRHTACYDAGIAEYLSEAGGGRGALDFPRELTLPFVKASDLRYGENPHQRAAFYRDLRPRPGDLAGARQLQGKELSYNNLGDAQAAWGLVAELEGPAVVAVKHANPCGAGRAPDLLEAWRLAYEADPVSIFGGIVAVNRPLTGEVARALREVFLEIVLAPSFEPEALEALGAKKSLRLLEMGEAGLFPRRNRLDLRRIEGGLLLQEADETVAPPSSWRVVTRTAPDAADLAALDFAWRVVKYVKSNAIVVAAPNQTLGIGAGQMNRIDAARIALRQAGERARGAYLASDAFFPFGDVVEEAARAGVRAIVQPGGSVRDQESIERADAAGIAMVFTGERHFRH